MSHQATCSGCPECSSVMGRLLGMDKKQYAEWLTATMRQRVEKSSNAQFLTAGSPGHRVAAVRVTQAAAPEDDLTYEEKKELAEAMVELMQSRAAPRTTGRRTASGPVRNADDAPPPPDLNSAVRAARAAKVQTSAPPMRTRTAAASGDVPAPPDMNAYIRNNRRP
jgi:hypothetical protein